MSEAPQLPDPPASWQDTLDRSDDDIAAGRVMPLLPALERLRATAERLEAELGIDPDGMPARR